MLITIILSIIVGMLQILEYTVKNEEAKSIIRFFKIAALFTGIGYNLGKL